MNVSELIVELCKLPPDTTIFFGGGTSSHRDFYRWINPGEMSLRPTVNYSDDTYTLEAAIYEQARNPGRIATREDDWHLVRQERDHRGVLVYRDEVGEVVPPPPIRRVS